MGIYKKVYDFAAKAGSLEGYVYPRESVDVNYLPKWSDNLVEQYWDLPPEVSITDGGDVGSKTTCGSSAICCWPSNKRQRTQD